MNPHQEHRYHLPGRPTTSEVLKSCVIIRIVGRGLRADMVMHAAYDANTFTYLCVTQKLPKTELGEPITTSELSNGPAYEVHLHDGFNQKAPRRLILKLTYEEIVRMGRLNLKPEEFKKLRSTHGIFFEIHDDFYDQTSGVAVQPR